MPRFVLYSLLVLVTASWGAVLPVLRYVNFVREQHGLSAWDIVWLRLVPGAICFLPFLLVGKRITAPLFRRCWLPILLVGLCTTSLYNFFLVSGEEKIPASIASLVIGVNPSVTFALSVLFLGEPVTWRKAAGMAVSLIGLLYISAPEEGDAGAALNLYHLGLTVLAPVTFSIGTVVGKRMLSDINPMTITASTIVAGAVPLLPLPLFQGGLAGAWDQLPPLFWSSIAFLVIVPLVLGYFIWYLALEHLDAGQVSAFVFLVPVFGVGLSSFTEPPSAGVLLGGLVILAGVLLTNWNSPRRKADLSGRHRGL